jgi:hypothetical protein
MLKSPQLLEVLEETNSRAADIWSADKLEAVTGVVGGLVSLVSGRPRACMA